jgi:SUN domain-containing protein 1/2
VQAQRTSVPRTLPIRPPTYDTNQQDSSLESAEQGLDSIPEVPEEVFPDSSPTHDRRSQPSQTRRLPRSSSRTRNSAQPTRFSIGGFLGRLVNASFRGLFGVVRFVIRLITTIFFICGRIIGSLYDVVLNQPVLWLRSANWSSPARLAKYLFFCVLLLGAWYLYPQVDIQSLIPSLPSLPSFPTSTRPIYTAPDVPAADITELALRIHKVELAISDFAHESEQTRAKTEDGIRSDFLGRLGALESRLIEESKRLGESESKVHSILGLGTSVSTVRRDVGILQAQLMAQARQREEEERNRVDHMNDEEARAKLQALEERVGSVEGDVKEAVELGRKASTNAKSVTLKIPGGQDLNKLIQEAAISAISKDLIGKVDYAMHSGGARVIPSLTSPSYEIQPDTLGSQFFGFLTGNGYAVGRPPVTALHHETHGGYCWPFASQRGQLGISLAAPVIIDEVTIDHISRDIALDIRSAPQHMEVWGLVEGGENLEKYEELVKEKEQRQDGPEEGEAYPDTLPQYPPYVRIANFTYDVDSGKHVQTFPVLEEIKDKKMDFGVVVLRVLSNWGREEFTCLYRFRVHGARLGGMPIPEPVEDLGL